MSIPATVEAWALQFLETDVLEEKRLPSPPPGEWRDDPTSESVPAAPGRPRELQRIDKTPRSLKRSQLANPRRRAQLLHSFWHHELQAAELMCWAILRFADTPRAFRRGLLGVCLDELRHMRMYEAHIERLGFEIGGFPVRDWFWQRVASCETPVQFVALMGIGFEGGNLDHTRRFATWFEEVGDAEGARLQQVVGDEEVAHVRFAWKWFCEWTGIEPGDGQDVFERWRAALVAPLTPSMMRGGELDRDRRREAGLTEEFLDSLHAWDASA